MSETKEERFTRVFGARAEKILHMLRLLGNCSRKSTYRYTKEQVEKVFAEIRRETEQSEIRFSGRHPALPEGGARNV